MLWTHKKQVFLPLACKINQQEPNSMWLVRSDPLTRPIYPLQANGPIVLNLSPNWQANILIPGSWVAVSWSFKGRCEMRHLCSSKTAQSSLKPWHSALKVTECLRWFYSTQLAAYSAWLTEGVQEVRSPPTSNGGPYVEWKFIYTNADEFANAWTVLYPYVFRKFPQTYKNRPSYCKNMSCICTVIHMM